MSKRAVTSFFISVKALINNKKVGGNGDGFKKGHLCDPPDIPIN